MRLRRQTAAEATTRRTPVAEPDAASTLLPENLINWRLAELVIAIRRSANVAYMRVTGLSDFDSRAIRHIGLHRTLLLTELAALLCKDKSQVSRICKRLVQTGVVSRSTSRAPMCLTDVGQAIFKRVLELSHARNVILIRRFSGEELDEFRRLIKHVQGNAREGLEAKVPETSDAIRRAALFYRLTETLDARAHERDSIMRMRLILPDLIHLRDLLDSSAESDYSGVSGLTNFEWRLVGLVAQKTTLTLIELVQLLDRDKSQVGRSVQRLVGQGLLRSEKIGGGRHVLLSMTTKGTLINDRLFHVAKKRNAQLARGLSVQELRTLITCFDKLSEGAAELVASENKEPR